MPNKKNGHIDVSLIPTTVLDYQSSSLAKLVGIAEQPYRNPENIIGYTSKWANGGSSYNYFSIIYFTIRGNNDIFRHDTQWSADKVLELFAEEMLKNYEEK